ncbi:hypothetical protein AWW68_19395 [Roseivirga spongicola]|uniref:Uncharacterized protein n=1 Tax=Roseivirga spongicola TaxID=333140 RepID=A0A150XCG7_9BACT|nr:hypothetical protein [Roseivirga spongicola]KYG76413.1 hypothetical protein AWW68_19395 [Roseivirga spongicola]
MQATNKTITQGNRLIAEFMGAERYAPNDFDIHGCATLDVTEQEGKHFFNPSEMKYHSSWDWLMPVVEKIESINSIKDQSTTDYFFQATNFIQNYTASIMSRDNLLIVEAEGEARIDASFNAVVEFIEWYNQDRSEKEVQSC